MIKYIGKQVDPLGNITYGDLSTEELTMFTKYLDRTFGYDKMAICKEYVEILKKNN